MRILKIITFFKTKPTANRYFPLMRYPLKSFKIRKKKSDDFSPIIDVKLSDFFHIIKSPPLKFYLEIPLKTFSEDSTPPLL